MPVTFQPFELSFGDVAVGQTAMMDVIVDNDGPDALTLSVPAPFAVVPSIVPAQAVGVVTVMVTPTSAGEVTTTLQANLDQGGPTQGPGLALSANARNDVVVTPAHVDFGVVALGGRAVRTVNIHNFGLEPVTLHVNAPFRVQSPVIGVNTSMPVNVYFDPTASGDFTAALHGSSNSTDTTELLASLSGSSRTTIPTPAGGQRYRVHVPTEDTDLLLGGNILDDDREDSLQGARLTTGGHVVVDAGGRIVLQSRDQDGIIALGGSAVLAADATTHVSGKGGVLISAGIGDSPVNDIGASDGAPTTSETQDVNDEASEWATTFASFDTAIAGALSLRALYGVGAPFYMAATDPTDAARLLTTPVNYAIGAFNTVGVAAALGGTAITGLGASGDFAGVGITAQAGISLAALGFSSFYSVGGLVFGSMYPITVGLDVEQLGLRSATVTGNAATLQSINHTTVYSHGRIDIEADGDGTLGAALEAIGGKSLGSTQEKADIRIKAAKIEVGRFSSMAPDLPTSDELKLGAKEIAAHADGLHLSANLASIECQVAYLVRADEGINLHSKKMLLDATESINVKAAASVNIEGAQVTINSNGAATAKYGTTNIYLG